MTRPEWFIFMFAIYEQMFQAAEPAYVAVKTLRRGEFHRRRNWSNPVSLFTVAHKGQNAGLSAHLGSELLFSRGSSGVHLLHMLWQSHQIPLRNQTGWPLLSTPGKNRG